MSKITDYGFVSTDRPWCNYKSQPRPNCRKPLNRVWVLLVREKRQNDRAFGFLRYWWGSGLKCFNLMSWIVKWAEQNRVTHSLTPKYPIVVASWRSPRLTIVVFRLAIMATWQWKMIRLYRAVHEVSQHGLLVIEWVLNVIIRFRWFVPGLCTPHRWSTKRIWLIYTLRENKNQLNSILSSWFFIRI